MEWHAARPIPAADRQPVTEPEHAGRQQRKDVDADHPRRQVMPPGRGIAGEKFLRQPLAEEEKADNRPDGKAERILAQQAVERASHPGTSLAQKLRQPAPH